MSLQGPPFQAFPGHHTGVPPLQLNLRASTVGGGGGELESRHRVDGKLQVAAPHLGAESHLGPRSFPGFTRNVRWISQAWSWNLRPRCYPNLPSLGLRASEMGFKTPERLDLRGPERGGVRVLRAQKHGIGLRARSRKCEEP